MLMRLDPDLGAGDIRPTARVADPDPAGRGWFGRIRIRIQFVKTRFYELIHTPRSKKSDPVFGWKVGSGSGQSPTGSSTLPRAHRKKNTNRVVQVVKMNILPRARLTFQVKFGVHVQIVLF